MSQRERMRRRTGVEPAELSAAKRFGDKHSRPAIDVRIDELRLHGIDVADRFRLADAVQGELMRILSEQGWPAHLRNTSTRDRLAGGAFSLEEISSGRMIGKQIAHALYRGFGDLASRRPPNNSAKPIST